MAEETVMEVAVLEEEEAEMEEEEEAEMEMEAEAGEEASVGARGGFPAGSLS